MSSTVSRGNYFKKKSQEYYQKLGYSTQLTEFNTAVHVSATRVMYKKVDVFAADGISMNGKEIIFWNSKHGTTKYGLQDCIREATEDFGKFPFPKNVKRVVIYWELRKEPVVVDIS